MRPVKAGLLAFALASVLPLPANATSPTFGTPVLVDHGTNSSEPDIVVDSAGRIFIDAPAGLLGPSNIWRATSASGPFSKITPANIGISGANSHAAVGGGDCKLALDASDHLYFVDLWLGNSSTLVSNDHGASWLGQPFGTMPIQDRPWVSADPRSGHEGTVYSVTEQIPSGIWISEAVSNPTSGALDPISVLEVSNLQRGVVANAPGNMVTDARGDTYNVYQTTSGVVSITGGPVNTPGAKGIGLSKVPGGALGLVGISNSQVTPANGANVEGFPIIAVDNAGSGNLYVVWTDAGNTWDIRFASFNGTNWSNAVTIGHGIYPWITAQAPGKVDVAWYGATSYSGDANAAPATTQWNVEFSQSVNALAATASFSTPQVAVANIKSGPICTQGTLCSGNRELGDFMSIAHDSSGNAMIAFVNVPGAGVSDVKFVAQTSGPTIN